mmetsp:Transcript_14602/g.37889  ORF Transcript_14602/g.37889 Transcript_14602/m.37889 type:complete len:214 (+) Transcript_14602:736-1377(+)
MLCALLCVAVRVPIGGWGLGMGRRAPRARERRGVPARTRTHLSPLFPHPPRPGPRTGVAILQSGQPIISRNTIAHGRDSGVLVCECGEGTIEHNLIVGNRIAGIAICSGAAPQLVGNRIGQGDGRSLCIAEGCRPHVESNTLEADAEMSNLSIPLALRQLLSTRNTLVDKVRVGAACDAPLRSVRPPRPRALVARARVRRRRASHPRNAHALS